MELTQYEGTDFIYVVRFKRLQGETAPYKEFCSRILN